MLSNSKFLNNCTKSRRKYTWFETPCIPAYYDLKMLFKVWLRETWELWEKTSVFAPPKSAKSKNSEFESIRDDLFKWSKMGGVCSDKRGADLILRHRLKIASRGRNSACFIPLPLNQQGCKCKPLPASWRAILGKDSTTRITKSLVDYLATEVCSMYYIACSGGRNWH